MKNKYEIISELHGALAMDKRQAQSFIFGIIHGSYEKSEIQAIQTQESTNSEKNILCIPITGTIFKNSNWYGIGTTSIAEQIKKANESNFSAIILKIDSYGGNALAVPHLGKAIKDSRIPVYAFVGNGVAISAAYWIASFCKEIYATYASDCVGGIGMFVEFSSWSKYYEDLGITIKDIYASKSTEKNKAEREAEQGNFQPVIDDLDFYNSIFINDVKSNRKKISKDVFEGATYNSNEALQLGLIDGLMSFENYTQKIFTQISEPKKIAQQKETVFADSKKIIAKELFEFYL